MSAPHGLQRGNAELDTYMAASAARHAQMRDASTNVSQVRRIVKNVVPGPYRLAARIGATRAVMVRERRKAARIPAGALLHLGSGGEPKPGWVNVDLAGEPVDLAWDLGRPLPFADSSIGGVFHEHTLEHLPLALGFVLTRECLRVLRPGARLRVGVPDAGLLLRSYCGDGRDLEELAPGRPSRLLAVQETFYEHVHVAMYDEHLLVLFLKQSGFVDVRRREFGDSDLPQMPDTECRRPGTLYVEGTKPVIG